MFCDDLRWFQDLLLRGRHHILNLSTRSPRLFSGSFPVLAGGTWELMEQRTGVIND